MFFPNLGQVPCAVLPALIAVPALGMSIGVLPEPIHLGDCARRNATVNVYPKNPTTGYPRYNYNRGADDTQPHDSLNIPPGVCLSGDYPLSRNLEVVNVPICSDGTTATWSLFSSRRCEGTPAHGFYAGSMGASWPSAPYYWSLIFRCNFQPFTPVYGDVKHIDAAPPLGPTKGLIQQGDLYTCSNNGRQDGNTLITNQKKSLEVDTCHTTRDYGLRIDQAATCKNGTRAQWARFSDDKCKTPMSKDPLVDINDNDVFQCKPLGDWDSRRPNGTPPNSWKVGSISFFCDGIPESEDGIPKPQPAAISVDACQTVAVTPVNPPTFQYPEPDTCIDHYGSRMTIYENAICPNGTTAILAQYRFGRCSVTPQCFSEIDEDKLGQCLATDSFRSFSFMCTGVIQRPVQPIRWPPRIDRGRERKATGVLIAGIVMLTVGILMVVGMVLRIVFKDEKRRAKVKVSLDVLKIGNLS